MLFTSSYNSPAALTSTISHDDGASMYTRWPNAILSSPNQTPEITNPYTLPAGAHTLLVTYVESKWSARGAILCSRCAGALDLGYDDPWFIGVGFMSYRRRSKVGFRIA